MGTKNLDDMLEGREPRDLQKRNMMLLIMGMVSVITIALYLIRPDEPETLAVGAFVVAILWLYLFFSERQRMRGEGQVPKGRDELRKVEKRSKMRKFLAFIILLASLTLYDVVPGLDNILTLLVGIVLSIFILYSEQITEWGVRRL